MSRRLRTPRGIMPTPAFIDKVEPVAEALTCSDAEDHTMAGGPGSRRSL